MWARDVNGEIILEPSGVTNPETGEEYMTPRAIPTAGGPAAVEKETREAAAQAQKKTRKTYSDFTIEDINTLVDIVETFPVTGMFSLVDFVPGSKAGDAKALVASIAGRIGIEALGNMRKESPTGGALGQVSEFENRFLQALLGNLDRRQSKKQFLSQVKRIKEHYLNIVLGDGKVKPDLERLSKRGREKWINMEGAKLMEQIMRADKTLSADEAAMLVENHLKRYYGLGPQ